MSSAPPRAALDLERLLQAAVKSSRAERAAAGAGVGSWVVGVGVGFGGGVMRDKEGTFDCGLIALR